MLDGVENTGLRASILRRSQGTLVRYQKGTIRQISPILCVPRDKGLTEVSGGCLVAKAYQRRADLLNGEWSAEVAAGSPYNEKSR